MRLVRAIVVSLLASAAPLAVATSQTVAPMPGLDEIRAWMHEHQPKLTSGDSGINAAIIVVDTSAKYVRSLAFALGDTAMMTMQQGVEVAVGMHHDTAWTNRVDACVRDGSEAPATNPPLCVLDGARVKNIDQLRFVASSAIVVVKNDEATKRYGREAKNGAVLVTTDTAALARYAHAGVTADNFLSFVTRRTRRAADGAPLLLAVLMVRSKSGS
jgi:hypothetical protein